MDIETDLSCPLQARCPGCPLGALPYATGLTAKGEGLRDALTPYRALAPQLLPARAAPGTLAYRLRAKLVSHGRALGLYERGSHRVVDVTGCRVLAPALARATAALRRLLPLPIYGADLRETSEGVLLTLLTEQPTARGLLREAAAALVESGELLSVAVSVRRAGDVRLLSGEPEVALGPSEARHVLSAGAPYGYATHGGFVQAHAGQASYVHAEIARGLRAHLALAEAPRVLELFAGNGSLALSLAKTGARVSAVEAYAPAIRLAERAAREQQLEIRALAADATRFAQQLAPKSFDAVVVNPPRRGLDVQLRRALGRVAPSVMAYVSCNPDTLARDAWHFATLGLQLLSAEPLDMIPWSDATEALAWFTTAAPLPPRVLFEDEQCLAIDKAPHDDAAESLKRVRSLPGCQRAIALDAWDAGVSGVCWYAKAPPGDGEVGFERGERELELLVRGTLRKQGTIARRESATPGSRYRKQAAVGRHSQLSVASHDHEAGAIVDDFVRIGHPILGEPTRGDAPSNEFVLHRHGLDRAFIHVKLSRLRLPSGALAEARVELAPDLSRALESLRSD
jgi:tRNA/tmRNA/rRNA uracil-C5-methylase (TrmA/RlmC/RlmD family)